MEGTDCFCCNLSVCWRNIRAIRGLKNKVLSKKGIVLLHYISGRQEHDGDPWIKKYIFPGVMVLSLWEMISCGSADGFYILDVENLRLHQILFTKGINNDLPMTRWY